MRGHATSPARCRLSAAVRTLAPGGMVTFTTGPRVPPPHAASDAAHHAARTARRAPTPQPLRRESQCMLQKYGGRERVHIALAPARRAAHLTHRAQRRGG